MHGTQSACVLCDEANARQVRNHLAVVAYATNKRALGALLWMETRLYQWRIQKFGIGGRRVRGSVWEEAMPLRRKFLKLLCKNSAFLCNIFACFKMHPVNRGWPPHPCSRPLESATGLYNGVSCLETWGSYASPPTYFTLSETFPTKIQK